jgi:uncharacterized membrane protein YagU involved in acid resistance
MWREQPSVGKGIAAGLIGGLFASWVMNQFQAGLSQLKERHPESQPPESAEEPQSSHPEPATTQVAVAVTRQILRRNLSAEEKDTAGEVVHYAFGAVAGAAYGALAETWPEARAGFGLAFGAALWFSADEIGVPALRLSGSPAEYPVSVHASALAAHAVYGVTTELLRRGLRRGWLAA